MTADPLTAGRAAFLPEAWGIAAGIEEALRGLASPRSADAERLLAVLTHRMAGSAALFGLAELARVAGVMEEEVRSLTAEEGARGEVTASLARGLSTLTGLLATEVPPEEPAEDPLLEDPVAAELAAFARREAEALEYFLPEMRELLDAVGETLVRVASGTVEASAAEEVAALFRAVHTLKGAAFTVGCRPVGEVAHRLEDGLAAVRLRPHLFGWDGGRVVLAAVNLLDAMAGALEGRQPGRPLAGEWAELEGRIDAWVAGVGRGPAAGTRAVPSASSAPPAPAAAPRPPVFGLRLQVSTVDALLRLGGELLLARNRLEREIGRAEALRAEGRAGVERLRRAVRDFSGRHLDPLPDPGRQPLFEVPRPGAGPGPGTDLSTLSGLELDRYDDFNVLARRLDEAAADLAEVESQEETLARELRSCGEAMRLLVDEVHAGIGRLRLVPLSQVFGRCARLARRAALAAGKEVSVTVAGERVEVDAAVAEQIWEPLLHLVQNAVDHGLEERERRLALGKAPAGQLHLSAAAEGRLVVVRVTDDGAGMDAGELRRRAGGLGLRPASELAVLSDAEALELAFLPGLSTAAGGAQGGGRSGRGVGLDVVRATLERLGGAVEVESTPGGGTTFRLAFPVTLVVSEALLVRAGEQRVALPVTAVERIAEAPPAGGAARLELEDGETVPLVRLAHLLGGGMPARVAGPGGGPVVLVGVPGRRRGLVVDEVLGTESAVVRPLGSFLAGFELFAGALLTRAGRLVLLLNAAAATAAPGEKTAPLEAPPPAPVHRPVRVLLADDSLSVRKALGGMLARAGYAVEVAADGEDAVARLEGGGFDLLITDLEMPRRNGYELMSWARRRPETARLPMMVVTTRVGDRQQELARQCGAAACLAKPCAEDLLLRTVAGLTRRAALRR